MNAFNPMPSAKLMGKIEYFMMPYNSILNCEKYMNFKINQTDHELQMLR